jgi:hypothetical protein
VRGIDPDIIFTADIQDLNIALFDGLILENKLLIAAWGTPNQIIGLLFREVFYIGTLRCLAMRLM